MNRSENNIKNRFYSCIRKKSKNVDRQILIDKDLIMNDFPTEIL